ncbi:MAG: alpha/beta hydrolase [Robiginitalea sp.]|nr:alpha/beta hydrolase [Robiginitalea sp.]
MKKALRFSFSILVGLLVLISVLFGHFDRPVGELKPKYAGPPSKFTPILGMDVHYRDEGNPQDSLPVVLLHGTGASLHTFDAWTAALKEDRRVVRMDLPGFGLTGPFPDRTYSMEAYVGFVAAFLSDRGIKSCILGGNSLGGQIAWNFTLEHPERVDKLILIDAAGYPGKSTSVPIAFRIARTPVVKNILTFITPRFVVASSVENVYADKSKVSEELVNRYFDLSLRSGNRQALIDRMQMPFDSSRTGDIKNITQPTLILWGAEDGLIPVESAYRFQRDLPNDTLVVLKDSGHVPMEEDPEESLGVVLAFIGD